MKTPQYTPLKWETEYDDNDNTIYTAQSCSGDGDGTSFYYRLSPRLQQDRIVWIETSDEELGPDNDPWISLDVAEMRLEAENRNLWDSAVATGDIVFLGEDEE
jgi:hypothetical protein